MSEDTKTNREEKFVFERRERCYIKLKHTKTNCNLIIGEKLSSSSEHNDSNATRITGSNAVS